MDSRGHTPYRKGFIPVPTSKTSVRSFATEDLLHDDEVVNYADDDGGISINVNSNSHGNNVKPSPVRFVTRFSSQEDIMADIRDSQRHYSAETTTGGKSDTTSLFDGTSTATGYTSWAQSGTARQALISALSSLYAMLLIIMSLGFEVSIIAVDSVNGSNYDFFYIYLYATGLLFLGYCYAFLLKSEKSTGFASFFNRFRSSSSKTVDASMIEAAVAADNNYPRRSLIMSVKRKITHSAQGAGSLYLRLGCVIFGVVGLISKGLHLFAVFDQSTISCVQGSTIAETALAGTFIFVQMFFIFENSKLVIHRFKSMARIGFMHLIATNLCMWIRSLVEEQFAIMKEFNDGLHEMELNHSEIDTMASINLHPLPLVHHQPMPTAADSQSLVDLTAAAAHEAAIIDEICPESIGYLHHRHAVGALLADVKPFMTTCIIEYAVICTAVFYILWRHIGHVPKLRVRQRKQRFHVDCSASTKGLFVGLLFMVFTIISMLIFFTKIRSRRNYEALWIFYASDAALYTVSIAALLIAAYRVRKLYYVPGQQDIVLLDDILLIVGLLGQLMFCVFSIVPLTIGSLTATLLVITTILRMIEVLLQTVFIFFGQRLATIPALTSDVSNRNEKPGRELITFLLLTNLSMFLINTFETHKAGANPLMHEFYGKGIWTVIVHSTTPLTIFYRFHSTVCLAEIWKQAYRVKETTIGTSLSFG